MIAVEHKKLRSRVQPSAKIERVLDGLIAATEASVLQVEHRRLYQEKRARSQQR